MTATAAVKTRGLCRAEQRETHWSFSGYATDHAHENTIRPRGYYRACQSCRIVVLTLADIDDATSFCKAIMADWLRRAGGASDKIDVDNVTGELYAHLWKLYNRWLPGGITFTSYASGIMRKKINTFVAIDVGDPTEPGRGQKAHSRTTAQSYDGLTGWQPTDGHFGNASVVEHGNPVGGVSGRSGLEFAYGSVALDPTGDSVQGRGWLLEGRDRNGAGFDDGGSVSSARGDASRDRGAT